MTTSSAKRKSFEDLFAGFDTDDTDSAFLEQILDIAAGRDPELPDLLRAGAIAQTLNPAVVGVLRDAPSDVAGNERLLGMLADFRFVLPHPGGGFTYHDNTRDALLADWRSTDEKHARFVELNQALAAFYELRFAECTESDRALNRAYALIARGNRERLGRLTSVIEAQMAGSLLEALHHQLMASTSEGFEYFKSSFYKLEDVGRLTLCQSLISTIRDFVRRQSPADGEPDLLAWLEYFDARATRGLRDPDMAGAERVLVRMLDRKDLPGDLRCWALNDLSLVYEEQVRMDLALGTALEAAQLPSDVDTYNVPLRHSRLGGLYAWLGDPEAAKEQYEVAIRVVEDIPDARTDIGVFGRLGLATASAELGEWPEAFEAATAALYLARTSFADDRPVQGQVAMVLAELLSRFDTISSDCAAAEGLALMGITGDGGLLQRLDCFGSLLDRGRVRTARLRTDRMLADLDTAGVSAEARVRLDLHLALTSMQDGREADAIDRLDYCIEHGWDPENTHALALVAQANRGLCRKNLADVGGAMADFEAVSAEWLRCGAVIDAALANLSLAGLHVKTGQYSKAAATLDGAESDLPVGSPHLVRLFATRGDLCRARADWRGAQEHYERALSRATKIRQPGVEAEMLRNLATVFAEQSVWERSSEYERRAAETTGRLAAADRPDTTGGSRECEGANVDGVRELFEGAGRTTTDLDRARQHLCRAIDLEPRTFWPHLNLSFVYAELEDWLEAAQQVCRVCDLVPGVMWTSSLRHALAEYVLRYVRQLDDVGRGHLIVGEALLRLSGVESEEELADLRAVHGAALALAGDPAAAMDAVAAAFAVAAPSRSLADAIAPMLDDEGYWIVDGLLSQLQVDVKTSRTRDRIAAVREELTARLDILFGLNRLDDDASYLPLVTPTRVEIGDELVPLVDSAQDGGHFIFELIPAMRERVASGTGVTVPGVRLRNDPSLPPRGFSIAVDEVAVDSGSVAIGGSYRVTAKARGSVEARSHVATFHPLTGMEGVWVVRELADGEEPAETDLSAAQYLVHRIECELRTQVGRFLGPQEVEDLVETWTAEADEADEKLVASVLPSPDARLRLTWVLQALVEDGVSVAEWRDILGTIRDEGGIDLSPRTLVRAVRIRLRDRLPGRRPGMVLLEVPSELEQALLDEHRQSNQRQAPAPRRDFERWLRESVAGTGPAVCLLAETADGAEVIGAIARQEDPLICAMSRADMEST